jgi:hypothetical protein
MKRILVILLGITIMAGIAVLLMWAATAHTNLDETLGIHGIGAISFGISLLLVAFVKFAIEKKTTPPEALHKQQTELKDERNTALLRQAASISWCVNIFAFGIMLFLLGILDYTIPAVIGLVVLGINCVSFIVSLFILKRRY